MSPGCGRHGKCSPIRARREAHPYLQPHFPARTALRRRLRSLRGGGACGTGGASQRLPRRFELLAAEVRWFSSSCVRGFHVAACSSVPGFRAQWSRTVRRRLWSPTPAATWVVSRRLLIGNGLFSFSWESRRSPGPGCCSEAKWERRMPKAPLPPGRWSASYSRLSVLEIKHGVKSMYSFPPVPLGAVS